MYLEFIIADSETGEVTASFNKEINLDTKYGQILLHRELDLFIRMLKNNKHAFFQLGCPRDLQLELPF